MQTVPEERVAWHTELCTELEGTFYEADPDAYRKLLDWRVATETDYFVAKRLYDWREALAKQYNMPPASIIGNVLLGEWAKEPLEGYDNWQKIRGLPHRLRNDRAYNNYKNMLDNARKEAAELNLRTVWARPLPHKYVRTREEADYLKENFKNFRSFLREKYGETVATLMLSATQCEQIVAGKSFNDLRNFAQPFVRESAVEFGLDMERYNL